jgi:hypothetical protein
MKPWQELLLLLLHKDPSQRVRSLPPPTPTGLVAKAGTTVPQLTLDREHELAVSHS